MKWGIIMDIRSLIDLIWFLTIIIVIMWIMYKYKKENKNYTKAEILYIVLIFLSSFFALLFL